MQQPRHPLNAFDVVDDGVQCCVISCGNCQVGTLNDPDLDNLADEGEIVTYNMNITNKGNVRMSDIQVRDGVVCISPLENLRRTPEQM